MPNFASALKAEIVRLARKEIRSEIESIKKASVQQRSEISELKKQVVTLEKAIAKLNKAANAGKAAKADPETGRRVRFTVKGLTTLRKRLGLTAADLGTLLGVSSQTIYNWEAEKSRPRQQQVAAFAALRGAGKRQAKARLKELAG
jgi:DNA-binding XRE family transcriptional regulator